MAVKDRLACLALGSRRDKIGLIAKTFQDAREIDAFVIFRQADYLDMGHVAGTYAIWRVEDTDSGHGLLGCCHKRGLDAT